VKATTPASTVLAFRLEDIHRLKEDVDDVPHRRAGAGPPDAGAVSKHFTLFKDAVEKAEVLEVLVDID